MRSVALLVRLRALLLLSVVGIVLMTLAACGGLSSSGGGSSPNSQITLTVGGKLDVEAQLLTKMYTLLLRHAGFKVIEKPALGTNDVVFNAITSGAIDLYPEFTATGLQRLGLQTTHDPKKDYELVKQGFESKYKIVWLDVAPLNDTYGICAPKMAAAPLQITKLSQLPAVVASQLTVATPTDGQQPLQTMESIYGIHFKKVIVMDEALTFNAVKQNQAQLNVCYTTSALIDQNGFVLLQDDKNAFPIYNPAPIVREDTLKKAPGIATALNPLAPKLTTQVSIDLQRQVTQAVNSGTPRSQAITQVATNWLKSVGLL
uniref:Glycine/betaine ABC transporter substrate-binding protein n=1 Tax=Thermogemmatispora argillosa TaxID=2045280 RepID=A0A455T4F8_9CHLR|nr:glycine/betaine ABC transporter substrate-binding protein [Thermogemmatispora argillosa]